MKNFFSYVWDVLKITIITVAIVAPIRFLLAQPFFVKGASMEPNFNDGQYLVINEWGYKQTEVGIGDWHFFTIEPFKELQRGEVAIFRYPLDTTQYYIKRIIGLPGETIEIDDGQVKIFNRQNSNGFILDESRYLPDSFTSGENRTVLKDGEYFVMGDNRQASYDSRRWGPVPSDDIIGKAWIRIWPFDGATIFSTPEYVY
ncbi:MAG: Signal peptidase I [Parcubacteria group bacterium GW2011_GWC2_42_6]|nr:MAG: Signal peptidase I [Parcubacteria group bacterium GW2011_GWA2_42_11]KKS65849.1 MAG: Signal peptidase I [Parcubacteria group bacterium GW2011_GWC2_42_6]KKT76472.1 MAG: Signal peptidase I [Parcubacteria group bacterium GW2011_GWF2_44_7]